MNLTVESDTSVRLLTKGTKCVEDIVIEAKEDVDDFAFVKRYLANALPVSFVVPENVTALGDYAFYNFGLVNVTLPPTLDHMGAYIFNEESIQQVTFRSTPSYIDQYALFYCPKLKTVRVPWSEGAVTGAPWGATNATIIYNYRV